MAAGGCSPTETGERASTLTKRGLWIKPTKPLCTLRTEGMLLAAWLSVLTCIFRGMQMPACGAGEEPWSRTVSLRCWWPPSSLTSGITTTFVTVSSCEQLPQLCSAWGKAELTHACLQRADTNSHLPQRWSANAPRAPAPPSQLFYPRGTSTSEIVMHLKCEFLAASSPEGWSLQGGDMLMVPSVRPAKQISKSSSIFTPAQVRFPTPTTPLRLWEVFQL